MDDVLAQPCHIAVVHHRCLRAHLALQHIQVFQNVLTVIVHELHVLARCNVMKADASVRQRILESRQRPVAVVCVSHVTNLTANNRNTCVCCMHWFCR